MGAIQHIWATCTGVWRFNILRMYWDDSENPNVECPIGDFFCDGLQGDFRQLNSLPVCVNPGSAFNCYWEMPFKKRALITLENISDEEIILFYQIDYTLTEVPEDCAYFHAQFCRKPCPIRAFTPYSALRARHYVGTYMVWGVNNNGWWAKAKSSSTWTAIRTSHYLRHGHGDYFCGSYNFETNGKYTEFSTPYWACRLLKTDAAYFSQQRFALSLAHHGPHTL